MMENIKLNKDSESLFYMIIINIMILLKTMFFLYKQRDKIMSIYRIRGKSESRRRKIV